MGEYSNVINRDAIRTLTSTQELTNEIFQKVVEGSSILPLMRRLPQMTGKEGKLSVLNMLPSGYWVNGDTGLKQTTQAMWKGVRLIAEELAVVVPIPDAVLEDADYDILEATKPLIEQEFYKKIDDAIILGKDKPEGFREGLIPSIINAGGTVAPSTNNLYKQISDAMGVVEEDGFDVNGILGGIGLKKAFREGLVDTTGQPLANSEVTELPRHYARNGAWDNTLAKFIVGDFNYAVYAFRKEIEFKIFDSGVITDNNGSIIYNLLQQDMKALRCVMRFAWALPNPVTMLNTDEGTRFPFALVEPTVAPTSYNVTFTVSDGSSDPVSGARVTFGGNSKKTNSSGVAVFKALANSSNLYEVEKDGATTEYGKVEVSTSAVSKSVTLNF